MCECDLKPTRRFVIGGFSAVAVIPALAARRSASRRFDAFRNGAHIGEQAMAFEWAGAVLTVRTTADFAVKLGPITAYSYRHQATERWAADAFEALETKTNQNGRLTTVSAARQKDRVAVSAAGRTIIAPATALPFTHWNSKIAGAPLFNPQDGKLLREQASNTGRATIRLANGASVAASRIVFRGDAYVEDYYGVDGAWTGLVGRLSDGSLMEYRLTTP
jgi:hypothetical protein